ncbi:tia invasion determinant [Brachyspira hampsonii]|uniref:Tia invasion determinant n=1 Tax=Brachyspira hampsonii TaxID=1287055 RepID=A0A1E5NE27_9SPIR|nr:tia invasion determinant [Brachyspira hampsonii]OEJ14419.1 tia invasion determinant [Brachyspira hampsonii]
MKFLIKKFLIICISTACLTNMLMSMDIGAYLSPKFIFNIGDSGIQNKENKKNTMNMYIGGGAAIGYNFDILHKYSTVRAEFEYLYRNPIPGNAYSNNIQSIQTHTFLFGMYYDINFLYVNYNNEDSVRSKLNNGKRPVMSVYLGMLFGGAFNSYILSSTFDYNGIFKTSTYYNKFEFMFGFGGGLAFHITPLISLDLGYRILLNINAKYSHDIVTSLRFNF